MKHEVHYRYACTTALFTGLIGALLAILYMGANIGPPADKYSAVSASLLHETGLLGSEAIIAVCFGLLALYALVVGDKTRAVVAFGGAGLRLVFLVWQYPGHWRPGWYFIMDPAGSTATSWALAVLGVAQAGAFVWAGVAALRSLGSAK
jgi:hypothetical protein